MPHSPATPDFTREPRSFADRIATEANAAGLRVFARHTQSAHGVDRGRAWVECLGGFTNGRREGSTTSFLKASDSRVHTGDEAGEIVGD